MRVTVLPLIGREVDRSAVEVIVGVAGRRRCHPREKGLEVREKQRLVFVDEQARRRMTRPEPSSVRQGGLPADGARSSAVMSTNSTGLCVSTVRVRRATTDA